MGPIPFSFYIHSLDVFPSFMGRCPQIYFVHPCYKVLFKKKIDTLQTTVQLWLEQSWGQLLSLFQALLMAVDFFVTCEMFMPTNHQSILGDIFFMAIFVWGFSKNSAVHELIES